MEHFFTCPYCWENISMILDSSEESSDYIEDCEVCCRPIELLFRFSGENLIQFEAKKWKAYKPKTFFQHKSHIPK